MLIPSSLTQPYSLAMKVGETITLSSVDGKTTRTVTVVGVYEETSTDFLANGNVPQIKTTAETARALSGVGQEMSLFYMQIDPQKVSRAEVTFGNLAPGCYIVNVTDLGSTIDQNLSDLLLILTTIASFSLLARIIIIANAVALAMLERRREIGILKAVGYTSGTVLRQVLIEYGMIGGMSALLASLLIAGALAFTSHFILGGISLGVSLLPILLLIGGAALLTMITALLIAWARCMSGRLRYYGMSKVVFFNIPEYGHTYPTLPLVAELTRRGEQVVYYSSLTTQELRTTTEDILANPAY